jgi:AraC-like DNA-binding protein
MQLSYKKIQPPENLKNYVRFFWSLDDKRPIPNKIFKIMADGCPGLFFYQTEKSVIFQNNEKLLPAVFIYGQATKHAELNLTGTPNILGACFYPNALKSIFGLDADELTDSCTDLDCISQTQGFYLSEKLLEEFSPEHQIEIISDYLNSQIQKTNPFPDYAVQSAISQIIESNGILSLRKLQKDLGLSERSLERKFKQNVGISPKLFSRIRQFQMSLEKLRKGENLKLSDIAYENEYADQSHFIRAFREFAGYSPNQYKRLYQEVGEMISEIKN